MSQAKVEIKESKAKVNVKKSNKKFVTTITTKIAPFDNFSLNDGNDVNNSTTEIINDRNKQIKGVLSSIIKLK